ncbi:MAG: hypothetical protein QOF04_1439 [Solirubrobacteraceae bacterium]|jgi:hypothetical protein|nr:hypothetical protein [Solirubrobacteraceae bacterium]
MQTPTYSSPTAAAAGRAVPLPQMRAALAAVAAGHRRLGPEEWTAVLAAVDGMVAALANGPRPGESDEQLGIWRNHERDPALAALADVLVPAASQGSPAPPGTAMSDDEARTALAAALRR